MCREKGIDKPLFADKSIVGSYEPLFEYWRIAEKRGLEKPVIKSEDIEYVRKVLELKNRVNLLELLKALSFSMLERVNEEVAQEAYKQLGINLEKEEAREKIAKILAGWVLEACKTLGIISFKGWRLPTD